MRPRTFAYEAKGSLVVYVGSAAAPEDREWEAYLGLLKSVGLKWQSIRLCIFVDRDDAAPNALQRKRAAALNPLFEHDAVVISDSLVARVTVAALRWLGVEIRAFASSRQAEALQHLQATPEEQAWLLETQRRLHRELHGPEAEK